MIIVKFQGDTLVVQELCGDAITQGVAKAGTEQCPVDFSKWPLADMDKLGRILTSMIARTRFESAKRHAVAGQAIASENRIQIAKEIPDGKPN